MSDLVTLKTVRWRQKGLESNWTCMVYFQFYDCLCLSSRRDVLCEEKSYIGLLPVILDISISKQKKVIQ